MDSEVPIVGNSSMRFFGLVPQIVAWYFRDHLILFLRTYCEYGSAFRESFSILFLLKTLFSPWKSITDRYPQKGFDLQAMIEVFFVNVTTRCIGACIRSVFIFAGIIIQIALLLGFFAYLVWWIVFPFLLLVLPFYLVIAFFQ